MSSPYLDRPIRTRERYEAEKIVDELEHARTLYTNFRKSIEALKAKAQYEETEEGLQEFLDYLDNTSHDTLEAHLKVAEGRLRDADAGDDYAVERSMIQWKQAGHGSR